MQSGHRHRTTHYLTVVIRHETGFSAMGGGLLNPRKPFWHSSTPSLRDHLTFPRTTKTRSANSSFLRQGETNLGEIDLLGDVHALEVNFRESGSNYDAGPDNRVPEKLLQT